MISLRTHQLRARAAINRVYRDGFKRVVCVMPTGSGKTILAGSFVTAVNAKGNKTLWLAARQELVNQAHDSLKRMGIDRVSVLRADDKRVDPEALTTVACIPTLCARDLRPDAQFVVLDECQHTPSESWKRIAQAYPNAYVLGLTATPERSDGSPLEDLFDRLVIGATYSELLVAGLIVDCDVIAAPQRQSSLALSPAQAYDRHGNRRRAVIFTSTVAEAQEAATNIPGARCVHGAMGDEERSESLSAHVVTNCQVCVEGWDDPSREVCILARGCGHASQYIQMVGRVLRPSTGKTKALLIDLVGCIHEFGHPLEDRSYSLTGLAISRTPGARSLWQCKGCGWIETTAPTDRQCRQCGEIMPPPKRMSVQRNGRVISVHWTCTECGHQRGATPLCCPMCGAQTLRGARASADDTDARVRYLHDQLRLCSAKGWSPYAARHRFAAKYGSQPSNDEWRAAQ
jgi:DNA repair protein RadD